MEGMWAAGTRVGEGPGVPRGEALRERAPLTPRPLLKPGVGVGPRAPDGDGLVGFIAGTGGRHEGGAGG